MARRQEELDKMVASVGRNVAGVQGDVRNLEDLDRLYAKIASDGRGLMSRRGCKKQKRSTKESDARADEGRQFHVQRQHGVWRAE